MKVKSEWVEKKWKHPVYSEILLKINTRTITVTQLAKEFKKTRNALIEQFHVLEKEHYLKREKKPKGTKNIVNFTINWKKIINAFHEYLKEIRDDLKIKKEYAEDKDIQFYFQEVFKGYHKHKVYLPLEKIFNNMLHTGLEEKIVYYRGNQTFMDWVSFLTNFHFTDDVYLSIIDGSIKKLRRRMSKG